MQDLKQFYKEAEKILEPFEDFVNTFNLAEYAKADHICYKCNSTNSYELLKSIFNQGGKLVRESMISERRIALFTIPELPTPLGGVQLLELSDQKPDKSQREGFDHLEAYPISGSLDKRAGESDYQTLVSYLEDKGLDVKKVERPHHTTHDIDSGDGFLLRLSQEPLLEKIARESS